MSQTVHQVRYRWSQCTLLGTRGMGPVESTLPADSLPAWDRWLRDHVWAAGPRPAFTFLAHDGIGALVRKVATAEEDGRPGSDAHVLVGAELTAQCALGLTSWDGWHQPVHDVLPWAALEAVADRGLRNLRGRAQALMPDELAGLFAQLLSAPGDSYTVIGQEDPLAATCALGDLLGRMPTFATDEADDSGRHLPVVVFMRQAPLSLTAVTRRRLVPASTGADSAISVFAAAVVDAYTTNGLAGIAPVSRAEPPADVDEVHDWASTAQFAPGVLADLPRLPTRRRELLAGLVQPAAIERVKTAAAAAPASDLGTALDRRLPHQVLDVLVEEAVRRVFEERAEPVLGQRLAAVGPVPLDLMVRRGLTDLDQAVCIAQPLLTPEDGKRLLETVANTVPYAEVMSWIDARAATDPTNVRVVFTATCARARKASREELRELAARGALVNAVRRFSTSERQVAAYLATLLGALRRRALRTEFLTELVNRADPAVLHALDTVIGARAGRDLIHRHVRQAYYQAHQLAEPATPPPGGSWWRRWLPPRHTPPTSGS